MPPTSVDEIHEIIQNFKSDKASDISIFVLKKCSGFIFGKLSRFINNFINDGCFPEILKIGNITPIYKKDDPQKLRNYISISVLSIFSKGSYIKDARKIGGRGVKQKKTPADMGEEGVKQNWTSTFGSNFISV